MTLRSKPTPTTEQHAVREPTDRDPRTLRARRSTPAHSIHQLPFLAARGGWALLLLDPIDQPNDFECPADYPLRLAKRELAARQAKTLIRFGQYANS